MAHTHEIQDQDTIFVIDPETRNISSSSSKIVLIQNDHNSEIFTFSIPRFVEGHDMNLCNKIEVHYTNLNKRTREESSDIYPVTDQKVEEDNLIFTWLISGNATKYPGTLSFSIKFGCIEEDSTYSYIWHTGIFKNVTISDGITNTELVKEKYSDVLENWKNQLIELGTDAMTLGLQSATVGQIAKIKAVDSNGRPTEWEAVDIASGSSAEKELTLLADINFEGNTAGVFEYTGLDDVSEIYIVGGEIKSASDSLESSFSLKINDIAIASSAVMIIQKTSGTDTRNSYNILRFNGAFWESLRSPNHTGSSTTGHQSYAKSPNSVVLDVGKAKKVELYVPNLAYKPVTGWMKIWVR